MKKILNLALPILLIQLTSAYSNSLSYYLDQIEMSTIFLLAVFVISLAFVNFALSKVFKDNKALPGVISLAIALLVTKSLNDSNIIYEIDSLRYWLQDFSWGGFIFIVGITILFGWIVYEEFKKKK